MGMCTKFGALIGIFLALFLSGCATQNNSGLVALPIPQEKIICADSDGGDNVSQLGFVSGLCADCEPKGVIGGNTDTCISNVVLMEFYCTSEGFTRKTIGCPNGCSNGACAE